MLSVMEQRYKIVVTVPTSHADALREAMGTAGAGKIGNYSFCSFSVEGVGRFKPEPGSNPTVGKVGKYEKVEEERIEMVCEKNVVRDVIKAIRQTHPYEAPAYEVYKIENW